LWQLGQLLGGVGDGRRHRRDSKAHTKEPHDPEAEEHIWPRAVETTTQDDARSTATSSAFGSDVDARVAVQRREHEAALACGRNKTVVATVLAEDAPSMLLPLAESASRFGFPCIVVQPFAPAASPSPLLFMLDAPQPPLYPRSRWCNSSSAYASRRVELHRLRMWSALADQGISVLGVDQTRRLLRDPLPVLATMRTRSGALPDVLGHTPGWFAKHFYISSPFFVRSTLATRALLRAATPRVRGAHEDVVFSEELNFGAGLAAACCHTECLGKQLLGSATAAALRTRSAPAKQLPMLDVDVRVEAAPGHSRHRPNAAQCHVAGLEFDDEPPLAPPPPNATANRWPRDLESGNLATHGARRYVLPQGLEPDAFRMSC
jgi:hypothetical protein